MVASTHNLNPVRKDFAQICRSCYRYAVIKTDEHIIVLTTCPNGKVARSLADQLVKQELAACVNIVANIWSVYQWQGKLQHDEEQLLIIKTRKALFTAIESLFATHHPYELPELVAVSLKAGTQAYLHWIDESTGKFDDKTKT